MRNDSDTWDYVITSSSGWFDLDLKSVWRYRTLLLQFVRRDFVSIYKQTALGPFWFILQPLFTTIIFTVVFGHMIHVPTQGTPPFLFYLGTIVPWNYFADCLNKSSTTFATNAHIFGKVYFPRIIAPLSIVLSSLIRFTAQFLLFIAVYAYYIYRTGHIPLNYSVFFLPILLILLSGTGLAIGITVTSATTKYKDLAFVVSFGTQILMYASPVIYAYSSVPSIYQKWLAFNPLTWILEAFRYSFFGTGIWSWAGLLYSSLFMIFLFFFSVALFNKIEKTFIDTI